MGYTITIGNAIPVFCKKSFPELYAEWDVEYCELEEAPCFPNDPSGKSNSRQPSYAVWQNFIDWADLTDLFYKYTDSLMGTYPGCSGIMKEDALIIDSQLQHKLLFEENKLLGFQTDKDKKAYNADLARLVWLNFWVKYAVNNCETPAIQCG